MSGGAYRNLAEALLGREPAGLAIDFTDMSAVVKGGGSASGFSGDPNDLLTYTAPSAKYIETASGLLVSGSTLRTAYLNGVAQGLLVGESRTNLILRSQEFTNAAWDITTVIPTANTAVAPDGTTTADRIQLNNTDYHLQTISGAYSAAPVTLTIWLKSNTGGSHTVNLNITAVGVDDYLSSVTVTTEWQRFTFTRTHTTAATTYVGVRNTSGVAVDILAWGAQFEAGSFATSYIQTFASTVTRAADNISLAVTALPYSTTVGTLYVQFSGDPALSGLYSVPVSISDVAVSETANFDLESTTAVRFFTYNNGGLSSVLTASKTASPATNKMAGSWAASDIDVVVNGGTPESNTSCSPPDAPTSLYVGSRALANHLNGYVKQVVYLPRKMTNAELQTLTTP